MKSNNPDYGHEAMLLPRHVISIPIREKEEVYIDYLSDISPVFQFKRIEMHRRRIKIPRSRTQSYRIMILEIAKQVFNNWVKRSGYDANTFYVYINQDELTKFDEFLDFIHKRAMGCW
jgi:hypothetical protein